MKAPLDRIQRVLVAKFPLDCPEMNSIVMVQLFPAAKVVPQVFEVIANDFVDPPTIETWIACELETVFLIVSVSDLATSQTRLSGETVGTGTL
jgi:hypothetical protein